jgi:hypothetical protein
MQNCAMVVLTKDTVIGLLMSIGQPLELPKDKLDTFVEYLKEQFTEQSQVTATNISVHLVAFIHDNLPDSPPEPGRAQSGQSSSFSVKGFELPLQRNESAYANDVYNADWVFTTVFHNKPDGALPLLEKADDILTGQV